MAWCKYEGPPLAATVILAATLTLIWLRPPGLWRRLLSLSLPLAGLLLGYLPWRLFAIQQNLPIGADHMQGFYPHQFVQAISYLAAALIQPYYFGFLWPAVLLAALVPAGACGPPLPCSWPSLSAATSWPSSWPTPWRPPRRPSSPATSGPPWTACCCISPPPPPCSWPWA